MTRDLRLAAVAVVLMAMLPGLPIAVAQTTNASITGLISDASGGVVPNATVTVTNAGTGVSRSVTTNEAGAYTVAPLIPGTYEVKVSTPGFKTKAQSNIILETGAVLKVDFQLEVGQVSERIEVTGVAPMLQTQESSVGNVVAQSQLERIPVNGRNFTRLILMMPGTNIITPSQSKGGEAGLQMYSVNGQRQQDSNYTIDGVDNNMMYMSSGVGAPPMDSIQEFRVATNNSAEYGRSAGANVNLSTKSGTRDLHGSLYEYFRNDKLDANDWFANRQGRGKVPFHQNQYGVAVGGPVVIPKVYNGRDKSFWFASWEGYRYRRGNTTISNTPLPEWTEGNFSGFSTKIYDPLTGTVGAGGKIQRDPFPGNIIPPNRINAGMQSLVKQFMPAPNQAGSTQNYLMTQPTANDRDIFVVRGDQNFGTRDTVWGRYMRQRVGQLNPSAYPAYYNGVRIDSDNVGVGWNHTFNPTTVLEARYGYNHPNNPGCAQYINGVKRVDTLTKAGIKMFDVNAWCDPIPAFQAVGQFTVGGGGGETIIDTDNQFDGKLSKMLGRHSLKMGGGYTRRAMDAFFANPTNGNADFYTDTTSSPATDPGAGNSFATLLLGYPSYIRRGLGVPNAQGRQNAFAAFGQDDWRVTDKLTVNLGVRWEGFNRPYDAQDMLGNLLITSENGQEKALLMWAGVNPLPAPDTGKVGEPARTYGYGRSLMKSRWMNFAPRVGIAYQINQKTVLRVGYGFFYNGTFMQELNDLRKFWPYLPQQEISPNRGTLPDLSISEAGPSFSSTQAIGGWPQDPNNRTPYSQQWNLFIQRELMQDISVEVGYVGSSNKHQIGYVGWNNAFSPGPGDVAPRRRLYSSGFSGNLDGGSNVFSSEYNSLQAKMTKRFSRGLSVMANYTWGRVMDDQSSLPEAKYQNMFDRRADWSRASFDIRQAFKTGFVYNLPFGIGRTFGTNWNRLTDSILGGWALEGIIQIQSGAPLNVRTAQDIANVGKTQERPNVIRNPNLPVDQRSVDGWFDTGAFVRQPAFTWGTAGANMVDQDGRQFADISVSKRFKIVEQQSLEFRTEFFNIPNNINFLAPSNTINSTTYGKITSATSARQIQFALRYMF